MSSLSCTHATNTFVISTRCMYAMFLTTFREFPRLRNYTFVCGITNPMVSLACYVSLRTRSFIDYSNYCSCFITNTNLHVGHGITHPERGIVTRMYRSRVTCHRELGLIVTDSPRSFPRLVPVCACLADGPFILLCDWPPYAAISQCFTELCALIIPAFSSRALGLLPFISRALLHASIYYIK